MPAQGISAFKQGLFYTVLSAIASHGAGIHPNPNPGTAGERHVYGHVWVTLAALATGRTPPALPQLRWLWPWVKGDFEEYRVVVDGAYAKRPFLRPAKAIGSTRARNLSCPSVVQLLGAFRRRANPTDHYSKSRGLQVQKLALQRFCHPHDIRPHRPTYRFRRAAPLQ